MWNKKKEAEDRKARESTTFAATQEIAPPRRPTVLELLKKRRADRIEQRKKLDREIEMLDHDITYVEVNPQGARVLEFIAARFNEEEKQPARDAPWGVP